jgi:hypothetical protein
MSGMERLIMETPTTTQIQTTASVFNVKEDIKTIMSKIEETQFIQLTRVKREWNQMKRDYTNTTTNIIINKDHIVEIYGH